LFGKCISTGDISSIVAKGKTSVIKGFKSKAGKTFDAALAPDKTTGKINFEFTKK